MVYAAGVTATLVGDRKTRTVEVSVEQAAKVRKPRSRVRPRGAPTHVRSVQLRLTPAQRRLVDVRLTAGVRFYNACLDEMLARSRKVRTDLAFQTAKAMPTGPGRTAEFNRLDSAHDFTDSAAMTHASSLRTSWLRQHILAQEAQLLGRRAFAAVQRWHLGLNGRPRFKTSRDGLRSLACKDPLGALHPKVINGEAVGFLWGNKTLIAFAKPSNTSGRRGQDERAEWAEVEALIVAGKVLSSAIVKTVVKGRATYRANLTCDGPRPQRHPVGDGVVSFDLGPSVNAIVKADVQPNGQLKVVSAQIVPMAPKLSDTAKQQRRLQRKMDRQHRAGSPGCFKTDGTHIAGRCLWTMRSKTSQATKAAAAELYRVRAAYRKTSHGEQINNMLTHGSTIHAEKLNYVAWQKRWGRSVRDRAPGMLVELSRGKAESAGGGLHEYSTYTTRLSQTCLCGAVKKKALSERVHRCDCGVTAQRDLFSAFLGLFVSKVSHPEQPDVWIDVLNLDLADTAWSAAHEVEWMPKKSTSITTIKRRGQVRPSGRSVARIKRRHARSDRASRHEPAQTVPTAVAA